MKYEISVHKVESHPDGVTPDVRQSVFTQTVDDLDVSEFIRNLNTKPRKRKRVAKGVVA